MNIDVTMSDMDTTLPGGMDATVDQGLDATQVLLDPEIVHQGRTGIYPSLAEARDIHADRFTYAALVFCESGSLAGDEWEVIRYADLVGWPEQLLMPHALSRKFRKQEFKVSCVATAGTPVAVSKPTL